MNSESERSVNLCACMGAINGEPYCYCEMKRRGLPTAGDLTPEQEFNLQKQLAEIFASAGEQSSD